MKSAVCGMAYLETEEESTGALLRLDSDWIH